MGGWDVFCCFCGAVANNPQWNPASEEEEYNTDILAKEGITRREDLDWMGNVRLFGYNSECRSISKAFISGPASYFDYGSFDCLPGDDVNFFTEAQMQRNSDGAVNLTAYQPEDNETINIPFHEACYEGVFKHLVALNRISKADDEENDINVDVLFNLLSSLCIEDYGTCLGIDYGEIKDQHEQYWWNQPGTERFVCNPSIIPRLQTLYASLTTLDFSGVSERDVNEENETHVVVDQNDGIANDCFSVLPPEILLDTMLLVSTATVNCLRTAAPSTRNIALPNGYWKARIFKDMPWLYDLRAALTQERELKMNWSSAYEMCLRASEKSNENAILGLVNRRRIWGICQRLAKDYVQKEEEEIRKRRQGIYFMSEMTLNTTPMARVAWPSPSSRNTFHMPVIDSMSAIGNTVLVLCASFNDKGFLAEVDIAPATTYGSSLDIVLAGKNTVVIPAGDWLKGIMLTLGKSGEGHCDCAVIGITVMFIISPPVSVGVMEGNKRLLHVSKDHWFLGLQGEIHEKVVSRLALLEGTPLGMPSENLVQLASPQTDMPSASLLKNTWKDVFPPFNMDVPSTELGSWAQNSPVDVVPLEWLNFGTSNEELSRITAFACDALFMSFQVRYSDRPTKTIGPRYTALRVFLIDGRGGERIVGVNTSVTNVAHAMHILTNFGRHCIFGSGYYIESLTPEAGRTFSGIVCSWAYGGHHLTSLTMLTSPASTTTTVDEPQHRPQDWLLTWPKDAENRYWDPAPPPPQWKETGLIYGDNQQNIKVDMGGNNCVTLTSNIASWLDFTKPVDKVEVWQCHPQRRRENRTQFKSIILHYSDGTTGVVGPSEFNPAYSEILDGDSTSAPEKVSSPSAANNDDDDEEAAAGKGEICDCRLYYKDHPHWPSPHHFFGHSWRLPVPNQHIKSLRIWAHTYMDGLQFVAGNGEESPVFGFAGEEGGCTGIIEFGSGVVGLKVMLDSNARPVTQQDVVILGMQALGVREG